MKALLVLALSSVCLTAMADEVNTPAAHSQPAVEQYSYSSELDIAKVISMSEIPSVYEDSQGKQHTLEYRVMGNGCSNG